jgi:hypothetical protein
MYIFCSHPSTNLQHVQSHQHSKLMDLLSTSQRKETQSILTTAFSISKILKILNFLLWTRSISLSLVCCTIHFLLSSLFSQSSYTYASISVQSKNYSSEYDPYSRKMRSKFVWCQPTHTGLADRVLNALSWTLLSSSDTDWVMLTHFILRFPLSVL